MTNKLRLIAGSGRSGTTWVLDAIADANRLRPVFEPLHPGTSEIAREFGYAYLTRGAGEEVLKAFLTAITYYGQRSLWTSYRIRPVVLRLSLNHLRSLTEINGLLRKWRLLAQRHFRYREQERREAVIVKCIRANLLLDWVHANFVDARIILLMRHPGAVVESQLRFPDHWDPYRLLARYRNDEALMDGPLREQATLLNQDFSPSQALTAIWCIENLIPATQAAANRYQIVFYEELIEQPETEWQRIAVGLDLTAVPAADVLERPSQQSSVRLQNQANNGDSYSVSYANWRKRLKAEDRRDIAAVLDAFRVDFYTVSANRPNVDLFAKKFLSN